MFDTYDRVQDLANKYLTNVRQTGSDGNIVATCPIHRRPDGSPERHPSFTMSLHKGLWQCYSCKERGNLQRLLLLVGCGYHIIQLYDDLFDELRKNRAVSRPAHLANNYVTSDPIPEATLGFFDNCPTPLLEEGFTEETLRRFEIGFDAKHYRITFPIRDIEGTLMGVSGRTVFDPDDRPRHKVYDIEYEDFGLGRKRPCRKSMTLWNGHTLYSQLFHTYNPEPIVVVEGYKACMWLHQAEIKAVVALMGSTLSPQQKWLIERIGGPTYLMTDNDPAGQKAKREIGALLAPSVPLFVVDYPYKQPSDIPSEEIPLYLNSSESFYKWSIKHLIGDSIWPSEKTPTT